MAKFTIYKDSAGQFRWRLVAHNGRITGDSGEGYATKQGCKDAVERVKREVSTASVEDTTT